MARTENDTWDLASSVGATATAVAAQRAMASQGPDPLLNDPWADPLVRAVGIDALIKLLDVKPADNDHPGFNRQTMIHQITVRTRFFDDFFTQTMDAGVRQAVILASGLDTRAYRLPWPSDAVVYEIDQPGVIDFKTRTLADLGAAPTAHRRTVAIDLRDDWPTALTDAGLDPAKPTAWSAEGLLVYLPPDAQDRLLDNVTALSAPGSRVACEHLDFRNIPSDWAQRLSERAQRAGSGIDLAELFYTGDRSSAGEYLTGHGWQVDIKTTDESFASNGFQVPQDEMGSLGDAAGYLAALRV